MCSVRLFTVRSETLCFFRLDFHSTYVFCAFRLYVRLLSLSGLITVMCLCSCLSFTHSPTPTCALMLKHIYIHARSHNHSVFTFTACLYVKLGRLCLINFQRKHCVLVCACACLCLFMSLCVSAVFVGPKCVLNLDEETSMFTFIIFLLPVSHCADGGCLELILLVQSMINMAVQTSVVNMASNWKPVWGFFKFGHDLKFNYATSHL